MFVFDFNGGFCNKCWVILWLEREILDSGIDSLIFVFSEGLFIDIDDILSNKRKWLVLMVLGGFLEDNVFINCDKWEVICWWMIFCII